MLLGLDYSSLSYISNHIVTIKLFFIAVEQYYFWPMIMFNNTITTNIIIF
jgi:hypothetical protein